MKRVTLTTLLAVALLATTLPSALAGPLDDFDQDRVLDGGEVVACGSDLSRLIVNNVGLGRLWCQSSSDLDYAAAITLPPTPIAYNVEDDADGDGFPSRIVLYEVTTTVDPKDGDFVEQTSPREYQVFTPDSDDNNPNQPVQSIVPLGQVVTKVSISADGDGDGLPGFIVIERSFWTFDRRSADIDQTPGDTTRVPVDTDDTDSNDPAFWDTDNDRVPDAAEPALCLAENEGLPYDGSCNGEDDYVPWAPPVDPSRFIPREISINPPGE